MADPEKTHRGEDEGTWYEWTRRDDGKDSIVGGSSESTDGSHYHAVYNDDEDRTLSYLRDDEGNVIYDDKEN